MDNTIIQQGRFTSTGSDLVLPIRSDLDWMMIFNKTQATAAQTTVVGVKFYWQRGFAADSKWVTYKSNAANAANLEAFVTTNGFTLVDTSISANGVYQATITAVSNAVIPVVTNTGINGLSSGSVVRLYNIVGAQQLGAMDFTVGQNTLGNTTFSLDYMPQIVAGTTGAFRPIDSTSIFYPSNRFITFINRGQTTTVSMSVTHDYIVGQEVRLIIPDAFGMVEANGLSGTILSITQNATNNLIELDIDSSAFTLFDFPLTAVGAFSPAMVVPIGEDTAAALAAGTDILSDATENRSYIGMQLAGGTSCPAGANADVIYWVAGKSFSVDNS